MKPKQCAALLTNNNQYLMHSVVKGLKGNFEPVISWYQELYNLSEYFCTIICLESKKHKKHNTLLMSLNAIKTGCFSHNYEVAQWCLRFITKLSYEFEDTICSDALYEWFINSTQDGGIRAILYVLKRHSDLIENVVNTFIQFSKGSLIEILKELMRSLYQSPAEYVSIVNDFTHVLAESKDYSEELLNSGLIDFWLEMCTRQADNDGTHSPEERTAAVTFLADLWILFTDKLTFQRDDLSGQILKVMKRASRDRYRPLRITALCQMFRLLDLFSKTKNSFAPNIYRALAMSLVENHGDSTTREYIMQNFELIFESQPTIPVGFVVEPLVNQLQIAEGVSYIYNSIDFQFFATLAKHPKLPSQQAVQLIDILAKIYLNDQAYAGACSRPLLMLISRFINDIAVRELLVKFLNVSLSMLLSLEKGKGSKKIKLPTTLSLGKKKGKETKEEKEANRILKKTYIVELARKVQKLRHGVVNAQMKTFVLSTNRKSSEIHGHDNVGCLVLLKYWGDPKAMMDEYNKEEDEKEAKEQAEREKNNQLVLASEIDNGNVSAIENNRDSMELVPYGGSAYGGRMSRDSKRGNLVPYLKKQPKGRIGRKAADELKRLVQERKEKEEQEQLIQKHRMLKSERDKRRLADELEKRKIEQGVKILNKETKNRKIIFEEGEIDRFKQRETKSGLPEIELFDFEEEEEREVEAIKLFMKKYAKLWKFFFDKYANMGFSGKNIRNFDQLNDKHNTINLAELIKLLKDHDFDKRYLTKEELQALIRLVNFKKIKKNDLTAMNYAGFLEWIIQASIYIFTKPPEDKSHFPPVECLQSFVRKCERAQRAKGGSTILFDDPDATSIGDATLLKALNKKIKEDPNYPIPEDYRKVKEKTLEYKYQVPEYVPMNANKKLALEILDDIIFEKLDFHFLEPIISYNETLKVKPVIRKKFGNEDDGRKTPRYLQSLDKMVKPKELTDKGKMSAYQKMKQNKQKPIKLRETLALEVAKVPKENRDHMKETAEALEEILQAFEKGYKELPNREKYGPIGMKNSVIVNNQKKRREDKKLSKEREEKRKKRDNFVKNKIQKKEEEKKKHLEETKDERKRKREAKKNRQKELKQKREKEREDRMKEYEEKKKEELEEIERRQKEYEDKEKAKKDKFEKENKQFLKEQAKKIRKDFKDMVKEKKSIKLAEKEYKEMEDKLREKMKTQMESYLKENKDNLKKDKEEKKALNKFITKKSVQAVFDKYNDALDYFFKYYAKSEYHDLTRNIEDEFETLNYKEFIKFGYETNVIPTIIPVHEIIYIFHQLVREKNDELKEAHKNSEHKDEPVKVVSTLDFEYFKKALVRISAVGQKLLGGQKGPLFEKKVEEWKKAEEDKKKMQMKLTKKFTAPLLKGKKKEEDEDEDLKRGEESGSDQEDGEKTKKSKKTREEGTLATRGAKPPRKKIILPNPKEDKLKNSTIIKGKLDDEMVLGKKSMRINKLINIDEKAQVVDHLQHLKVKDTRITSECDVSLITDKTIEALLKYFGLDPEDDHFAMDRKLNAKRMDIQGAKPTSIRKQLVPEKAEVLSNVPDSEEESASDGEAKTQKSKKDESDEDRKSEKSDGGKKDKK